MTDDSHDLGLLLRSRVPLIVVEARDETGVTRLFSTLALWLAMPVMAWSAPNGFIA